MNQLPGIFTRPPKPDAPAVKAELDQFIHRHDYISIDVPTQNSQVIKVHRCIASGNCTKREMAYDLWTPGNQAEVA